MNKNQEPAQAVNSADQDRQGTEGDIARSVMSKARWGRHVLSPWVQRALSPPSEPNKGTDKRQPLISLTGSHTSALLNRLQRMGDKSAVWQSNIGASRPETVDRFTTTIVNRFAQSGGRQPQIAQRAVAETDLTLAGAAEATETPDVEPNTGSPPLPFSLDEVRQAVDKWRHGGSTAASTPTPTSTSPPTPSPSSGPPVQRQPDPPAQRSSRLPTMAEVRAALEKPHFAKSSSSSAQKTTASPVQKTPSTQQPPGKPTHIPPRRRPRPRIEEVTPDKRTGPPTPPAPPSPSTSQSVQPRRDDTPSAPPQKKIAGDDPSPETAMPETQAGTTPSPIQRQPAPDQSPPQRPATAEPAKPPPVQRQTGPSVPRKGRPSRPTAQPQPEGQATPPSTPPRPSSRSDEPTTPMVQRQSETETTQLPLPPTPLTPGIKPSPAESVSPVQRQPDEVEPPEMRVEAASGTEQAANAKISPVESPRLEDKPTEVTETAEATDDANGLPETDQQQAASELPLRKQSLLHQPPTAPSDSQPTSSVQRQREEETAVERAPNLERPEGAETPVQRQTDGSETPETDVALAAKREEAVTDTAAVDKSDGGDEPATKKVETADDASGLPEAVQRQTGGDLPLRKRGVPNQPPQTPPASQPPVAAEKEIAKPEQPAAPVQRQREETTVAKPASAASSEPDVEAAAADDTPVVDPVPPVERPLDELESPELEAAAGIEEAVTDASAGETSGIGDDVAVESPATTPVEAADEADNLSETVQRQAADNLPLRKQALPNQPPKAPPTDSQPAGDAEKGVAKQDRSTPPVQRQQEAATVEEAPEFGATAAAETPVQRHLDEFETPDIEAAAGLEETATGTSTAETSENRDEPAAATTPGEAVAERREVPATVQRQAESDLPLRQQTPPHQPPTARADSQPAGDAEQGVAQQDRPTTSVQRQGDDTPAERSPTAPAPGGEPDVDEERALPGAGDDQVDLNQDILTKAEAGSRLPLAKLPAATRQTIVQPKRVKRGGVLPQARETKAAADVAADDAPSFQPVRPSSTPSSSGTSTLAVSQRTELPLARPARIEIVEAPTAAKPVTSPASPFSTVQRQVAETGTGPVSSSGRTTSPGSDTVQREPETTTTTPSSTTSPAQASAVDLDKLARQVYPEIKRLLARERDRLSR